MAHMTEIPYINKNNIIFLLDEFAKDLKNRNNLVDTIVDILVVGGSALALKYEFRSTVDIDADIRFSGNVSDSIDYIAKVQNIPRDWLNQEFTKSSSYSRHLWEHAIFVGIIQNYLRVWVVSDLDQLCMKAVSGRNKDTVDVDRLLKSLIVAGCTFDDVEQRFKLLYHNTVEPKQRMWGRIKRAFRRNKALK